MTDFCNSEGLDFLSEYDIESQLRCYLDEVLDKFCTQDVLKKWSVKRENGSIKKGDYSVSLLGIQLETNGFETLCEKLQLYFAGKVDSFSSGPFCRIIVRLNRLTTYQSILCEVFKKKAEYGMNNSGKNASVLIMPHFTNDFSLSDVRTRFITEHVALSFLFNGYKIYLPDKILLNAKNSKNVNYYSCNKECHLNNSAQDKIRLAFQSEWKVDFQNRRLHSSDDCSTYVDKLILDGRQYLNKKNKSVANRYIKNIGYLYINENPDGCLRRSMQIKHLSQNHTNSELSIIMHIVPENKAFITQQSGLLSDILDNNTFEQYYVVHGKTLSKADFKVDEGKYNTKKCNEIKNSLVLKYGSDVVNDTTWKVCIENLTNTVARFDFLLPSYSTPIKLNVLLSGYDTNEKSGVFVQYNCARLSMLFKHFEDCVIKGGYQPLPNFENIDFSQLKLQEEWNLFHNYVIPFPALVKELIENISNHNCTAPYILTHKIPKMLVSLSRDLSIYYNKIRILADPHPQLQKRMFARLYLLQSIHQVMKCALALLNLCAIDKM